MDDTDIAHLAGYVDAKGRLTVHIRTNDQYRIGYEFLPLIRIHVPLDDESMLGKLDAFADEKGVRYSLNRKDDMGLAVFEVRDRDGIERFLHPLMKYLVSDYHDAEFLLTQAIPAMRSGQHLTKPGFYRLVKLSEPLRDQKNTKYTAEHFEAEWGGVEALT